MLNPKKQGLGLDVKTFEDEKGTSYIVIKHPTESGTNSYHVFAEVDAKQVAKLLGNENSSNTANAWNVLWRKENEN